MTEVFLVIHANIRRGLRIHLKLTAGLDCVILLVTTILYFLGNLASPNLSR